MPMWVHVHTCIVLLVQARTSKLQRPTQYTRSCVPASSGNAGASQNHYTYMLSFIVLSVEKNVARWHPAMRADRSIHGSAVPHGMSMIVINMNMKIKGKGFQD